MVDPITSRRWIYRGLLLAISALVIFFHLLPIQVGEAYWPGPDFVLAFAFAWVMRRPDYVPVLLLGGLVLLTDMLFLRPPGLWAALAVIGLEFLRAREHLSRDLPFPVEWAMVAAVLISMTVAYRFFLVLFAVDQGGLGLSLMQLMTTIAVYPLIVLVSGTLLGINKIAPGEVDDMGHRL
ncbi:MAG: rod shape-determining protein MreD [Halocynthiibacter sp.]|jgi:rod shape-determining protein MreD